MKLRAFMLGTLLVALSTELQAGIVITTSNQQTVEALISEVKSLSWDGNFKEGNLVVNYTDGSTKQLAMNTVEGVTFTEDAADAITSEKTVADKGICIYDMQGRLVQQKAKADAIQSLPKGEYIIKNGSVTVKFLKK